jgi:hypothetical protein
MTFRTFVFQEIPVTSKSLTPHYRKSPGAVGRAEDHEPGQRIWKPRARAVAAILGLAGSTREPSLVSSCMGAIERMMLTIPLNVLSEMEEIYTGILATMPATTTLLIVTNQSAVPTIRKWAKAAGAKASLEIFPVDDDMRFTVWAEDGYAATLARQDTMTCLVEPFEFKRRGDSMIADVLQQENIVKRAQSPLYFQGGNILVGDNFFLIGADYPARTVDYTRAAGGHISVPPGKDAEAHVKGLYSKYLDPKRTLHYVAARVPVAAKIERPVTIDSEEWTEVINKENKPGTVQPVFHIDMFITLVGRNPDGRFKVLVGDPSLAYRLLEEPAPDHAMIEVFDDIARGLEKLGFDVMRNPLPLAYEDNALTRRRLWYFASSNNCLVQNSARHGRIVWLPTYGHGNWEKLRKTDAAMKALWERLGFEVRQLPDFHALAADSGALHCIKKYLARGG